MVLSKEGDLVPTDVVLSKVVPAQRVIHIVGDFIPFATVLSNVIGDLVNIGMLLSNINPATASYQSD